MVEKVFLTKRRREILEGAQDKTPGSTNVEKTRIRKRARMALQELIEVAESPEIDNEDVFNPANIGRLIDELYGPRAEVIPRWDFDGSDEEYFNEYQYQFRLQTHLNRAHGFWTNRLLASASPPVRAGLYHRDEVYDPDSK